MCIITHRHFETTSPMTAYRMHWIQIFNLKFKHGDWIYQALREERSYRETSIFSVDYCGATHGVDYCNPCLVDRDRTGFLEKGSQAGWHVLLQHEEGLDMLAASIVRTLDYEILLEAIRAYKKYDFVNDFFALHAHRHPPYSQFESLIRRILDKEGDVFEASNRDGDRNLYFLRPMVVPTGTLCGIGCNDNATLCSGLRAARVMQMQYTTPSTDE